MLRRLTGFSLSLIAMLAISSPAAAATFVYPDFASTSGLQLNGSASQAGNVLQLTPAEPNKIGTAFSTSAIDPQQSFQTSFAISMHDGTAVKPADGMALVIQSSLQGASAMSPSIGGSLGYNGIAPSLAVEFDPFYNPEALDPLKPHISINPGTTGAHIACAVEGPAAPPCGASLPFPLYGSPLYVWVDFDSASQHLKVFVSQAPAKPAAPLLDQLVSMGPLGTAAYIGFTASTGGNTAVHDLLSWSFNPPAATTPPATTPTTTPPGKKTTKKCKRAKQGKGKKAGASKAQGKAKGKGKSKGKKCGAKKGKGKKKGHGGKSA